MTTIDNKHNTIVFDDTTATVTITHKKPRNNSKKVEFGPHAIPYGAIAKTHISNTGFTMHGYRIDLKDPLPEASTGSDLYGVWIHRSQQDAFESAINHAATHQLEEQWEAPQVSTFGARLAASVEENERAQRHTFGDITITGEGVLTYKGHEFPTHGARATVDQGGVKQKVGAGRVVGGAVLAGPVGAVIGGMAKKSKGDISLEVQLADGRVLVTTGPVKSLKKAQDVASRINDAGLGI